MLFVLPVTAFSQEKGTGKNYTFTVGGNFFRGFVIKHDQYMGHLSQGITSGGEIFINRNTYGHQVWEQVFKYPDIGVSLSWYDYGSEKLGQSLGAFFYSDFILKRTPKFEALFKLGSGLGFHTKPYHPETNNQNVTVGGPVSMSMQLRLGANYKITDRWKLTGALTISHFSVAAITQPNKGVNIVTANVGTSCLLSARRPEFQPLDMNYRYNTHIRYNLNFNYALKEIPPIGGPKYSVYVLQLYANKQVSKTNIFNLGVDGFSNTALIAEMEHDQINPETVDHKRIGIVGGHELKMNRVSMLTQLGFYIYRPYKTDKFIYQRYALKFYLNNNFYLHYGFVAHYAKADHAEWGIGITL